VRFRSPSTRIGWLRTVVAGAAGLGVAGLVYARLIEPRRLQTVRYRLGIDDLPDALVGLRIAHLTDFHVGMEGTSLKTLRRAIGRAIAERPDLVALTGDFTHDGVWERDADLFATLSRVAPTVAVLGNHDYDAGERQAERTIGELRAQGVHVLRNTHAVVPVRDGAGELLIVAVDDPHRDRDDLATAMAGVSLSREPERPALLLGHVPDIVNQAPPGRFALTLAGHTHGGQLRFSPFKRFTPLELPMIAGDLDSKFPRGTHVVNANPLFVNNGLGVSGVPFRFLAPPQMAVFTLARGTDPTRDPDDAGRYLTKT
jgi:hypothetical protein